LVIASKPGAGLNVLALTRFVKQAANRVRLRGNVNVLITSNREMRSLNRRFRGKDKATDVLSFPAVIDAPQRESGDIAISLEMARENARLLGHTAQHELKILILHGLLHLAGYDHESDHGEMARKEQTLRKSLSLPAGLIARSTIPKKCSKKKSPVGPRSKAS
jgi:probable rRNA maturation factor